MTRSELSLSSQLTAESQFVDSVNQRRAKFASNPAAIATAGLRDPQTGQQVGLIVGGRVRTTYISNSSLKSTSILPSTVTRGAIGGFSDVKPQT